MKTSPSDKRIHIPQSFKRKRMYSMRSYGEYVYEESGQNTKIIKNLQKSLQKDNMNQVQPVAQPKSIIPGFEEQKVQNKLWKYFLGRIELVKNKVQRQQVNVCQKQLFTLKKQIQKRKELLKKKIAFLQQHIRDRYKEIHNLFEQIKSEKTFNTNNINTNRKKNKKNGTNPIPDNNQKIIGLKDTIENIRTQIHEYQSQLQLGKRQFSRIQKQWLSFLKNLLKEGFYLKNGVISIFNEIILLDQQINAGDLPVFLDEVSKKCLLEEFGIQRNKFTNRKDSIKGKSVNNYISDSKKGIQQLMQKNNLANIYNGTKDMMTNWIKKQGWKEEIILPKIQTRTHSSLVADWRENQRKRIIHVYQDKQIYNKVRNILFGPKVETNY